jgi:hypothetical protein
MKRNMFDLKGGFQKLFRNSNGFDLLSQFILIIGLGFLLNRYTMIVGVVIIGYALFRIFSRNKTARFREEIYFENLLRKFVFFFKGFIQRVKDNKTHKILKCPKCSQKLRVPRHKGKINITCRKCGNHFIQKT